MIRASVAGGVAALVALIAWLLNSPVAYANSAPVVTNVVAVQIAGTGQVRVTYDVSDADGDQVTARLVCSSNNGASFDLLPVTVSGDVNVAMTAGPGKQIIWDAAADYPGRYWAQVVAKVYASDGPALAGEMVFIPAGNFIMGTLGGPSNEQPQHTVYLDAYYIDKFEVTNAEYQLFIDGGGYTTQAFWSSAGWTWKTGNGVAEPAYWGNDSYRSGSGWPSFPVIGISWYEAEAYANFAGKRLPTEAEWEKAARGTDARLYPWGATIDASRANYAGSGDPYESGSAQITPVGFYDGRLFPNPVFQTTDSPSPYGCYDVAGNAWEWIKDWYSDAYYSGSPSSNPQGPISGTSRGLRGGSWSTDTTNMRCAIRYCYTPTNRAHNYGFRCTKTAP